MDNPFYKKYKVWDLPDSESTKILVLFTTPKIPKYLNCLEDCFSKLFIDQLKTDCEGVNIVGTNDTDVNMDCIMFKKKEQPAIRRNIPGNKINQASKEKREAKEVREHPVDDDESGMLRALDYIIPGSPSELALSFCILANLDKRGKLPAIDESSGSTYTGTIYYGADCSEIFPKIFAKNNEASQTRVFGASSSNVKR